MASPENPSQRDDRLRQLLIEDWRRAGIDDLLLSPQDSAMSKRSERVSPAAPAPPPAAREASPRISEEALGALPGEPLGREERREALARLREEVAACCKCLELSDRRTQTVFGVGDPMARLCFLGEAPGADEDAKGEPFVGRAGKLLTRIIEACQMTREEVYILNVLKCRPPGNRAPLPLEAEHCRFFLDRQLEIIRPEFLVCLGASAAQTLLHTTEPIGAMRGHSYRYRGIRVLATYHPAYLLRNPSAKRPVWEDMKRLMREMGIELPPDSS